MGSEMTCDVVTDVVKDSVCHVTVVRLTGEEVVRLQVGPSDTTAKVMASLREQCGHVCRNDERFRLAWRNTMLRKLDVLSNLGIADGDTLALVRMSTPIFELVTNNARAVDHDMVVRVEEGSRHEWGWASAFTTRGCERLSLRLGPTSPAQVDRTDYFIGAMPEQHFQPDSNSNFLGDRGVGLVLSSHSHWSGDVKVQGSDARRAPFGPRKFFPGDVVSVALDTASGTICFAHRGEWTKPIDTLFSPDLLESVRLGASLYCEMERGPVRSLEICGID